MSVKMKQSNVAAPVAKHEPTARPAKAAVTAQAAPALGERAQKRLGKVASFTSTNAALQPSPAPTSGSGPTFRAGSASSVTALQAGGKLPTSPEGISAAEDSAARNFRTLQPWSMLELRAAPRAFLQNVVQLDGDSDSTADQNACGPTALLMGMIAGDPRSVQALAAKLTDGNFAALFADAPAFQTQFQEAVGRLKEGKAFTPADVTVLAEGLQAGLIRQAGTNSADVKKLATFVENLGVKLPPMELQLFGDARNSMGHWRVVSGGTQYNPWPNDQGQSSQLPVKAGLAAGRADGEGWSLREQVQLGGR